MAEKKFFDMSPTQSLVFGLISGVAVISLIGFLFLLVGGQVSFGAKSDKSDKVVNVNANVNTNVNPTPTQAEPEAASDVTKLSPVTSADHIRGNANAKVTLIVISDFQCPYCQRHEPTMQQVLKNYGDKVRIVWRNFPLTSIHPYAEKAAEAAECAGEQDKFWEMHDKLFENQSALTNDDLKSYAKALGLNTSKFNDCLDSSKMAAKIAKQSEESQAAGVSGTPGTFVNDQLVKGAYPYDTFKTMIDALLK
ncbi:MAG: thioredoxin domain-containing protein [Patescibacteria group bacterium]